MTDPLAEPRQRERARPRCAGGLAWLDRECARRFEGRRFVEATRGGAHGGARRHRVSQAEGHPARALGLVPDAVGATQQDGGPRRPRGRRREDADEKLDRLSHGVAFFSAFRDLTASGFWSSEMGVKDIEYVGNTFVAEWKGCPPEVLAKLGLYEERSHDHEP